jgi:hypothetical protein
MPKNSKNDSDSDKSRSGSASEPEEEEYVVEKVVDKRMKNGKVSFNNFHTFDCSTK